MTNQDHIDEMLAKLRERIPGLEWERDGNKLHGFSRWRGQKSNWPVMVYEWDDSDKTWEYRTCHDIGFDGQVDQVISNGINSLYWRSNQIRSALKGAK